MVYERLLNILDNLISKNFIKSNSYIPKNSAYFLLKNLFNDFENIEYVVSINNDDYIAFSNYIVCYNNYEDKNNDHYIGMERVIIDNKITVIINLPLKIINDDTKEGLYKLKDLILFILNCISIDIKLNTGIETPDIYRNYIAYYILKTSFVINTNIEVRDLIFNKNTDADGLEKINILSKVYEECLDYTIREVLDYKRLDSIITYIATNE